MTALRNRAKQIRNRGKQKLAANGQSPSQPRVGGPGAAAARDGEGPGRSGEYGLQGAAGLGGLCTRGVQSAPPPPFLRTNRTRRVLHPVLIGHAASFTPY